MASEGIVISGISCRLPQSDNMEEFKENLFNGVDMVHTDKQRFDTAFYGVPRFGQLKDITRFDASFFDVAPSMANRMDPALRLLLEVTYEAIADSGVCVSELKGTRTGVFVGAGISESHFPWTSDVDQVSGYEMIGCEHTMFANRISYAFDFKGPSYVTSSACSSSLLSLHQAFQSLQNGDCDTAVVAGAKLSINPAVDKQFMELGMLSPNGRCATFDESADGYCRSEGVVVILLQKKTLAKRVYCDVVNTKTNSNGHSSNGITFPSEEAQTRLLQEVYKEAGLDACEVSYVEAHGTGTKAGDAQEASALCTVFCKDRKQPLLVGSVKSNMGHCEHTSGLASIAKLIIAMEYKCIPSNLHYNRPNPNISGLYNGKLNVVCKHEKWEGGYVGVNGFGFGGTNVHVILNRKAKEPLNYKFHRQTKSLVVSAGRSEESCRSVDKILRENASNMEFQTLARGFLTDSKFFYRGVSYSNENVDNVENVACQIQANTVENRPVWFVYSGMGSQWHCMGRQMMEIDAFKQSIRASDAVLKSKGVNLYGMIMDTENEKTFQSITNGFVGIAAVEMALTDTLRSVGIHPDGMFGHSVGELACAYADGCLSREQTLLVAYVRGRCIEDAKLPEGAMAATGLSWKEAVSNCPEGVVPACHNATDSVTISGKRKEVADFVQVLKAKNIFAKEVDTNGIAFHSFMMENTKTQFASAIAEIIPKPLRRSQAWISTSVRASDQHFSAADFCSAEYLVNNLINPVLFHDAVQQIPPQAVVIEVSPHCLLQAILKRSLTKDQVVLGLMDRRKLDGVTFFLSGLGSCWLNGINIDPSNLYKENGVTFPVSAGTPMISPLLQWNHSETYDVPAGDDCLGGGLNNSFKFRIDTSVSGAYAYLHDHTIDGRALFPATGHVILAWTAFAKRLGCHINSTPVVFKDVKLHQATLLPSDKSILELLVTFRHLSADSSDDFAFDISNDNGLIVTGIIAQLGKEHKMPECVSSTDDHNYEVDRTDIYKDLRLLGYHYGRQFQEIAKTDLTGRHAKISWTGNWTTFLDALLQQQLVVSEERSLCLPNTLTSLVIDPVRFIQSYSKCEEIPVLCNDEGTKVTANGVYLGRVKYGKATQRLVQNNPSVCSFSFKPYMAPKQPNFISKSQHIANGQGVVNKKSLEQDHEECISEAIHVAAENCDRHLKVLILEQNDQIKFLQSSLDDLFFHDVTIWTDRKSESDAADSKIKLFEFNNKHSDDQFDLVILSDETILNKGFDNYVATLGQVVKKGGFVLVNLTEKNDPPNGHIKTFDLELQKVLGENKFMQVFKTMPCDCSFVSLWRKPTPQKPQSIICISHEDDFSWVHQLQNEMSESLSEERNIWLVSRESSNGIIGLFKCLQREPGGRNIRCLVDLSLDHKETLEDLVASKEDTDLAINVLCAGHWGSFRDMKAKVRTRDAFSYVDVETPGDMSSIHWKASCPPTPENDQDYININTHFAALNFRDIMLATGKMPMDVIKSSISGPKLGMEFSGTDEQGNRVMGLTQCMGIATSILAPRNWVWKVPDDWTLEEAATVPAAYCTAFYALVIRGNLAQKESILIHSGSGSLGQASIAVALSYNCTVFVTVGNEEKKRFLLSTFPELKDNHIYSSRTNEFEAKIMEATNNQGVDVVLNSLSGEKLEASIRIIARDGRFLEVGKADILRNKSIGMGKLLYNVSIQGVHLDMLQAYGGKSLKHLRNLVQEGLNSGLIRPLRKTTFERCDAEAAFRYMTKGTHIGKILIKIRDEDSTLLPVSEVRPRTSFSSTKCYIITGGLGGLGIELVNWMLRRGAKNFIITSRSGVTNGFQRKRLRFLQKKGANISITQTNIAVLSDVEEMFIQCSLPVGGVFHLAGCIRDELFETMDPKKFEDVCSPKIDGVKNLDALTRTSYGKGLDWFVVFSSIIANRGNPGQCNYGYANSFMERHCEQRHQDGLPGLAIQFGLIGDVGMAAENIERNAVVSGTRHQSVSSVLACLDKALNQSEPVVSVCVNARRTMINHSQSASISETVFKIMGLEANRLPKDASLSDVGLDSLLALEVKNLIERHLNATMSAQDIRKLTVQQIIDMNS